MSFTAEILGKGWVSRRSMGRPGHVHEFSSPDEMRHLSGKNILDAPYKPFGRMDHFSKQGFAAIAFAMADAGYLPAAGSGDAPLRRKLAVIAESATGCLETDTQYQETLLRTRPPIPSPALFAYTLPSCFLGEAAIYHGLTGESFMVETGDSTGLTALAFAMDSIDTGGCEAALCGICNAGSGAFFMVIRPVNSVPNRLPAITRRTTARDRFFLRDNNIAGDDDIIRNDDIIRDDDITRDDEITDLGGLVLKEIV